MHTFKISVITVCYNCDTIIKETCLSVLSQTYDNFEYVIIDGGSKDKTNTIINEMKVLAQERRIHFINISERDNGVYDAMNKGAKLASGEFIIYMNAGDFFFNENVLSEIDIHLNSNVDVLYGDTEMIYNWGRILNKPKTLSKKNPMPFIHQSCITKRSLILENPFDLKYKIISDHNLYYQLLNKGANFVYAPIKFSTYEVRTGLSAASPLMIQREHAKIHGYTNLWWYPILYVYNIFRSGLLIRIKNMLPKKIRYKIERRRYEKLFNSKSY